MDKDRIDGSAKERKVSMPTACGHETVISLRQAALEAGKAADKQLNDLAVQRINKPASSLAHAA